GLHPSLTGLHELWGQGKAAVVCNVGSLVEPTNRDSYRNRTVRIPANLFSHSDQQNQWQTSVAEGTSATGWGGRTADRTGDFNATRFPPVTSTAGTPIFTAGSVERPLAIAAAPTRLDGALRLDGFPNPPDNDARYVALQNLLLLDQGTTLARCASRVTAEAVAIERAMLAAGDPVVPPLPFSLRTSVGHKLEQLAKLISLSDELGLRRHLFFSFHGGL